MTTIRWNEGWRWDSGVTWGGDAPATTASAVRYRVLCDFDRDGYFLVGAAPGDPLNLLPDPAWFGFGLSRFDAEGVVSIRQEQTNYGVRVVRVSGVGFAGGMFGLWIGTDDENADVPVDDIEVQPSTTYTFSMWARGLVNFGASTFNLQAYDQDVIELGSPVPVTLTGDWQRVNLTFTTAADTTHVAFAFFQDPAAQTIIEATGFMLVEGSTPSQGYNAGNALDDISQYVISVNYHYGFAEQLDFNVAALFEGMAEPAECTIELDNSNWDFLPEDSGATFYELFGPGMLVKVQAEVDNTTYPMFIGRLKRVALGVNPYGQRRAHLTVQDISYELLDAEYLPELQTNVTVDRAIAPIFEKGLVPWPYAGRFWLLGVPGSSELGETTRLYVDTLMHFDTARTTLGYAGDNLDNGMGVSAQGAIRDYVAAEAGGRFFYDARTATYKFHNRAYDVLNRGIAASFTESDFLPEPETMYTYGDGIINALTVSYEPREASDDIVVLWSYDGTITLRPGESRTLTVRYRDPDNPDARVGATNVIPPVYNVDFTARNENGTLVGVGYIGTAVQAYGDRAELTLNNGSARSHDTIIISNLRLRGKAIKAYAQQQAFATDPVSIAAYERRDSPPFYLRAVDDADFAQQVANWYVNRFSRPIARYAYVSFEALQSDTLMGHALRLNVGDHINISHARIGHDKDYVIVGMMQSFRLGSHRVRLVLAPLDRTTYWLLGVPGSSELGETTRLFL